MLFYKGKLQVTLLVKRLKCTTHYLEAKIYTVEPMLFESWYVWLYELPFQTTLQNLKSVLQIIFNIKITSVKSLLVYPALLDIVSWQPVYADVRPAVYLGNTL